jgi:Holliday junction resolvasome RuvABC endonuclease subunit
MRIVGVDPGVTTGLCSFDGNSCICGREVASYHEIDKFITEQSPKVVVMEDFYINRSKPAEYHAPIRVIGVVEYICEQRGIHLVMQSPAILKLSLSRAEGMHRSRHVRSACAHVIHFLRRKK